MFHVDFAALARYGLALRELPDAPRPGEPHALAEIIEATSGADAVHWTTPGT